MFQRAYGWLKGRLSAVKQWADYVWSGPPCSSVRQGLDPGPVDTVPAEAMRQASARDTRHRFVNWLRAYRPEPAPSHIGPVDKPPQVDEDHRIGVCCSGGGIRSAAFNLGALQALQEAGELERAKYLSAVSGGSYIAAAFATIARRWPSGRCRPDSYEPGYDDSDPSLFSENTKPFYRGSPEEQYLRNRASYMAPSEGAKVLLGLRLLLGLLWNLLFIGAALLALGVAAGFLYREFFFQDEPWLSGDLDLDLPKLAWLVPATLVGSGLLFALTLLLTRPRDGLRRFLERWTLRLLGYGIVAAFVALAAPLLIEWMRNSTDATDNTMATPTDDAAIVAWTGLISVIAGVLTQVRTLAGKGEKKLAEAEKDEPEGFLAKSAAGIRKAVVYGAATIAVPVLALIGFIFPAAWTVASDSAAPPLWTGGICAGAFVVAYFLADLTTWSLHPFYKRRLAIAFALKRVKRNDADTFGVAVERDYNALPLITESDIDPRDPWPVLVVCAAANVSDFGATPPGRSVTSFTFSAGAIGGPLVGAVKPEDYRSALGERRGRHHVSLLTAVAVSGAALSPSMGKETRRPLRALLALANVRLGVWMRNPRHIAKANEGRATPRWRRRLKSSRPVRWIVDSRLVRSLRFLRRVRSTLGAVWRGLVRRRPRPSYLLYELLGLNYVDGKYLYVTDGGHYENLGLVELLRRGCTEVYCFDASGGKPFGALGDAIALARSEVGVEICVPKAELEKLRPNKDNQLAEANCVVGTITYAPTPANPEPKVGRFVYVRTVLTGDARADVHAFHEQDPRFPNHSTTDQLYTDQKFEAYRALGEGAGCNALGLMRPSTGADVQVHEGPDEPDTGGDSDGAGAQQDAPVGAR